ncbi:MAG: hypothetical protein ACFFC7_19020 [Candidatus Hermodarchaeota archaeon]
MSEGNGLYRCRLCNYVIKGEPKGVCPCCGAPKTAFVPHTDPVNPKRRQILELDLHPVATHFPVGFAIVSIVVFIISFILPEITLGWTITFGYGGVLDFFVLVMPLVVAVAGVFGLVDSKVRYKTYNTPYIKLKIVLGVAILVVSIVNLLVHSLASGGDLLFQGIEAVLLVLAAILAALLGWFGAKLYGPVVPK